MRKFCLLAVVVCICLFSDAQPLKGFSSRMLADSIVQITWQHDSLPYQEYAGDAVENKNPPAYSSLTYGSNDAAKITEDAKGFTINIGGYKLEGIRPFFNGQYRGLRIQLPGGMPWFGGGERTLPLDRRGQRIPLYNAPQYGYALNASQLNYSVPFIFCANGVGLLFDNPATGYIDFGKSSPGVLEIGFVAGNINMVVIPGETPDKILQRYAQVTGHQPLPPRWALGNFMSRFGYRSQQQVMQTVTDMQAAKIPLDAVVIDVFWFGNTIQHTLGNLEFVDEKKWPDPKGMIDKFSNDNINTILVTEPFILQNTKNFLAAQPYLAKDSLGKPFMLQDFYFGIGGLLDLFRPDVRQWFFSFYKKYTDMGVAGWWGDLGEPEKHPAGMMHNLGSFAIPRRMPADHVHNLYGHMWSKMLYDGWRKHYPAKRLFYLNRAGFAGSQRYGIFPWTGDVSRSWDGLKSQLLNLQSMSISGVPYIHSDAGGFSMVDRDDPELYVRWMQMAIFTPILRPHGTDLGSDMQPENTLGVPSEPVYKPEPYKTMAKQLVEERYRLLPYHYSLAYEATTLGKPFIRPMFYYNSHDTALTGASGQYMYGDAFLVAPVTDSGAVLHKVFFPEGKWYAYDNPRLVINGKHSYAAMPTSTKEIPAWVKAGSFVPYWNKKEGENTTAFDLQPAVEMRFFPGSNNGFTHYNDDGKSNRTLDNVNLHSLNKWSASISENAIIIKVDGGNKMLCQQLAIPMDENGFVAGCGKKLLQVIINGKTETATMDKHGAWLHIKLPSQPGNHEIKILLE